MEDPLLFWYYVASYVLGVTAVAGFIYSIRSSRQVSAAVKDIQESLASAAEPLVQFTGYDWVWEGQPSCENLPHGIIFSIANVSRVAVQIHSSNSRYFYGQRELKDSVSSVGGSGAIIMPPGGHVQNGIFDKEFFQSHLKGKRNVFEPPYVTIEHTVEYSRLNDRRRFRYHTIQQIGFDCSQPLFKRFHAETETVTGIAPDDAPVPPTRRLQERA
jgi:hypothetical protein